MRPVRLFYCALLLDSELDSNLNCFWPPPRGLEPDQPWTSLLTWKTLLDFFYSIPCTNHGRMHGCHVLINGSKCKISTPHLLPLAGGQRHRPAPNRRSSGRLVAWVRRGTGRGGQGKLVGTLTDGRDVEGRPESGRRLQTRAACSGQVAVASRWLFVNGNQ
jgi:hypothetical protein